MTGKHTGALNGICPYFTMFPKSEGEPPGKASRGNALRLSVEGKVGVVSSSINRIWDNFQQEGVRLDPIKIATDKQLCHFRVMGVFHRNQARG